MAITIKVVNALLQRIAADTSLAPPVAMFSYGSNQPGYMPDSDPSDPTDFKSAQQGLLEDITNFIFCLEHTVTGTDMCFDDQQSFTDKINDLNDAVRYISHFKGPCSLSIVSAGWVWWIEAV